MKVQGQGPKDLDVLCLGEALVDLVADRPGRLAECRRLEVHTGGAPANVAVGLARLGLRAALLGVVGDDELGDMLIARLAAEGVEARLRRDASAATGLVLVAVDARGERTFFCPGGAGNGAEQRLRPADVDPALVARARWLHAGTFAHVAREARGALLAAVAAARAAGTRVSFDPNVRAHLWRDVGELERLCGEVIPACDLVKVAEDECDLVAGAREPDRAAERLEGMGARIACVTLGARGALVRHGGRTLRVPAERVDVVDTTGAGDGFVAGFLARLAAAGDGALDDEILLGAARLGCHVAGRVCGRPGAVAGLPRRAEIPGILV